MTYEYTAWVTTSQTMPEGEPGIGITLSEVDEYGNRDERGEVQISDAQGDCWGVTDSDSEVPHLYEPEADDLLATMGWERTGPWILSSLSFAATVTKKET